MNAQEPFKKTSTSNRIYLIVIIYDISDDKRRLKIAKKLSSYGSRVQLSAYECYLNNKFYKKMLSEVLVLIDENNDLLRIYKLNKNTEVRVWGKIGIGKNEDIIII